MSEKTNDRHCKKCGCGLIVGTYCAKCAPAGYIEPGHPATSRNFGTCRGENCRAPIMWALLPSAKHGGELRPHPFDVDATPKGMHEIARRVDGTLIAQHNPIFTGARYMTHYATCPDAPGFREQAEQMQLERQREYEYQVAEAAAEGKPEPYSPADLLEMDSRRLRSLLVGYGITHAIGNRETLRMMVETMQDEHHGDEWRDIAIRDISPEPPNDLFGETDEPATAAPVADLF